MQEIRNKRVIVAGLGRFGGGIAVARWLAENGAKVLVTDQAPADKLSESLARLDGLPIEFRLGEQREEDRQLRLVLDLAGDHRERIGVEDREQLVLGQPE